MKPNHLLVNKPIPENYFLTQWNEILNFDFFYRSQNKIAFFSKEHLELKPKNMILWCKEFIWRDKKSKEGDVSEQEKERENELMQAMKTARATQ